MTIKIGDKLPAGTLTEAAHFDEAAGCPMNPEEVGVLAACRGKRIVIFGLPGAYTPTCSAKHLPGYLAQHAALKAKGVDEIWCVSVNDAFVMGLELDRSASGMGLRMQRFSMLVEDGVVKRLNIEAPGKFEVSDAETMLQAL